jgi:hypothetical protein
MLWIDIGAFCGYKRGMLVAESSLQVVVTVKWLSSNPNFIADCARLFAEVDGLKKDKIQTSCLRSTTLT